MSVVVTETVSQRSWSGFAEAQFPAGFWFGAVSVLGDASGGSRNALIEFKPGAAPPVPRLYSLEQYALSDADGAAKTADITFNGFDRLPGQQQAVQNPFYTTSLQSSPIAGSGVSISLLWQRSILLGIPQNFVTQTLLQARLANIDAATLNFYAQGYFWNSRSFQAPGGPQRPSTALWA